MAIFYRYLISGKHLPDFLAFVKATFDLDTSKPPNVPEYPTTFPESRLPELIKEELERIATFSMDGTDRLYRAHGQTLKDVFNVRNNSFRRIPDAVIWPESHEQVRSEIIVLMLRLTLC